MKPQSSSLSAPYNTPCLLLSQNQRTHPARSVFISWKKFYEIKNRQTFCILFTLGSLSALRLCVWLFHYRYLIFFYINQCFLLTFWTKQRKTLNLRFLSNLYSGLTLTDWTIDPFFFVIFHNFPLLF